MTTATPQNKQPNFHCIHCNTEFHRKSGGRNTCTEKCRKAHDRAAVAEAKAAAKTKAQTASQLERWCKSAKGLYHIRKCRDARTVEIMQGHTTESLLANDELHNRFYKCYGWNPDEKKSAFHICHVQSHKGRDGSLGLLDARQLFIGGAAHNQAHSDKPVPADAGMSIPAHKLDRKWNLAAGATDEAIAKKIRSLLGKEFDAYLLAGSIKLSTHYATAQRVFNRQQKNTAVNKLDRTWTKPELEALDFEVLEAMDAYQAGKDVADKFKPEVYTRALLCVYAEELERFGQVLPAGRHRDNCLFMLPLVRVLGIYLAQTESAAKWANVPDWPDSSYFHLPHRRFLKVCGTEWQPVQYNSGLFWGKSPCSVMAYDFAYMQETILQGAFDALQGLAINKARYEDNILKRLHLNTLVADVPAPDQWSWEVNGSSWDQYISGLYASYEPVWQALLDLDLCTADQIEEARIAVLWSLQAAIEKARHQCRNDPSLRRWHHGKLHKRWGWKGYPEWLEYPAVIAEMLPPSKALPCDEVEPYFPLAALHLVQHVPAAQQKLPQYDVTPIVTGKPDHQLTIGGGSEGQLTMSTKVISELTGKRHADVLRDVRNILEELEIASEQFCSHVKTAMPTGGLRSDLVYNLPRREVDILLTGYSIPLRAKVIDRWRELEAQVAKPVAPALIKN